MRAVDRPASFSSVLAPLAGAAIALAACRDREPPPRPPPTERTVIDFPWATIVATTPPGWTRTDRHEPGERRFLYAVDLAPPAPGGVGITISLTCLGACADVAANLDRAIDNELDSLREPGFDVAVTHRRRDADTAEYVLRASAGDAARVRGRHLRYRRGWTMALDCRFETDEPAPVPPPAETTALLALCRGLDVREPRARP